MLVTQNVDGLHSQLMRDSPTLSPFVCIKEPGDEDFFFTEGIYEIHGNAHYSRCFDECTSNVYPLPKAWCGSQVISEERKGGSRVEEEVKLAKRRDTEEEIKGIEHEDEGPDGVPLCPDCRKGLLRPHVLWFDENYSEAHYKSASVRAFA